MKRIFLPTVLAVALMLASGTHELQAQNASDDNKVVVIVQSSGDDGTVVVKKKRLEKGKDLDAYLEEINVDNVNNVNVNTNDGNYEITVITSGDEEKVSEEKETVFYFRSGKEEKKQCDEMKHMRHDMHHMMDNMRSMRITVPNDELALLNDTEKKAFMGVYSESGEQGVLLTGIVPGSGAEKAGLKEGDIVTQIEAVSVKKSGDISAQLALHKPGDVVTVAYLRNGQAAETTVTLGEKAHAYSYSYSYNYSEERDPCRVFIGVYVGDYGNNEIGVGINGIIPGWPAEEAGLQAGDRIVALDGNAVDSHRELVLERDSHKPGDYFTITYLRDGVEQTTKARFRACEKEKVTEPQPEVPAEELVVEPTPLPQQDLNNSLQLEEFNAYPNPTFGDVNVRFQGEAVPTLVRITDVQGRVVFEDKLNNFDGLYNKQVDLSNASPGKLTVTVQQDNKVLSKPLVLLNRA